MSGIQVGRNGLFLCLGTLICSLLLASCGGMWGTSMPATVVFSPLVSSGTPTWTPFQPAAYVPSPTPVLLSIPALVPTPTGMVDSPSVPYLWISPAVPEALRQFALAAGFPLVATPESSTARLDVLNPQSSQLDSRSSLWIYTLVTPFPTTTDGVSLLDIQNTWTGTPSGPFAGQPLWMDETTLAAFSMLWGASIPGSVQVAAADKLVDSAWAERPAWAIIPFEVLEPRWKVLSVDGQSPLHNDFDPLAYPLKVNFSLQPAVISLPAGNRDTNKLTVLAMTGVTALVRGTADRMENKGLLYPGEEIRSVLRAADLTHVSNEISFDANCPVPDPWTDSLLFCSDPRYIALLEDVGVDIVELTGNHLLDYGRPADLLTTLDMYDQRGWKYFGGGRDLSASLQPALLEHNGNQLAFIGCNFAGPPDDWATDSRPGSAPCDLDSMAVEITHLRSQGYLPIMTFQYAEYYQTEPDYQEQLDFQGMADAGAVIVSGSQAHMPAAMEFHSASFIHYGLGNLFFDQMSHLMLDGSLIYDTRNVFVDRHVFYEGRYLGTELLTYIIEDYARPRLMTDSEREEFLQDIFRAAGW